MVVLSAEQIRAWDEYTMQHEPIASIDLMERAASSCYQSLHKNQYLPNSFAIFCGKGNNGGDGLAIARLLSNKGFKVFVCIIEPGQKGTDDFQTNLARLHQTEASIYYIQSPEHFPTIPKNHVIIDALFGTGLNRPLTGLPAALVAHINTFSVPVIAIDMPSGLLADSTSVGYPIINAIHTLSFECLKMAFMMAENEPYTGQVHILDIGLLTNFLTGIKFVPEC